MKNKRGSLSPLLEIINMLEQKPIVVFFKYIIPSILGLLAISSASIVDGYFVGNYVGSIGLASVNITYPIFSLVFGVGLMFAAGSSVIVSKLLGEKKNDEALDVFSKTIISVVLFSIISCGLIYLNIDNILDLLNIKDEFRENSYTYLSIMIIFLPFVMVGIVVDYFVRADENPNLSFLAFFLSAIINIILDYLFIVEFEYGLEGAAYATGISYASMIFILLPHFFTKNAKLKLIKPRGSFRVIFHALKNGISEFINESSAAITVMVFNFMMIKYLGSNGVAAYTIISYFIMMSIIISFAISSGLQPVIAKHYGAQEFIRIKTFVKLSLVTILICSSMLVLLVIFNPIALANIFLNDQSLQTKDITVEFLSYTWVAFLFIGVNIFITSYLTAINQPFASAVISISRSLILPIFFVAIFSYFFGIIGVYLALPFSEIITFIVAIYFFKKSSKS